MGWATEALVTVYFNRETFDTRAKLENYIEERKAEIETAKKHLHSLAVMTEPQKFCGEGNDPMSWVEDEFDEWMELLEEATIKHDEALLVLDGWDDMHHPETGVAYDIPEGSDLDEMRRIRGDFIAACQEDGSCAHPDDPYYKELYDQQARIKKG